MCKTVKIIIIHIYLVTFRWNIDKQKAGPDQTPQNSGSPLFAYRECHLLTESAIKVEKGIYYS